MLTKSCCIATSLIAFFAFGASAEDTLKVTIGGIAKGQPISPKFAHCAANASEKSGAGDDISPAISWTAFAKAKSYAVVVVDPDVPTVFDDAGKEGKTIPASMKRQNFYHWVLVDIPAKTTSIGEGYGKDTDIGVQGINDYPKFMGLTIAPTEYLGYNGPCPPWNDERIHHYHFRVYALGVESLKLKPNFPARDAIATIEKNAIAKGEVVGTYTLNPVLKK